MPIGTARQDWEHAARELETYRDDPRHYRRLLTAVEAVTAGLRARVGQTFTLEELARAYDGADDWARTVLDDDPESAPTPTVGTLADAAFHLYARGASDYRP